jgi:hypothetical protein
MIVSKVCVEAHANGYFKVSKVYRVALKRNIGKKEMNYSEIISALNQASGFDLFRLSAAIDLMLGDPKRIIEVKKSIQIGSQVEYFEASENRVVAARVLKFKRTRVIVENLEDNRRWSIPYYAINIHNVDTSIVERRKKQGLDRTEVSVGQTVGFVDRNNIEQYGKVVRLNQKTVTMENETSGWRVPYSMLFAVHEQTKTELPEKA